MSVPALVFQEAWWKLDQWLANNNFTTISVDAVRAEMTGFLRKAMRQYEQERAVALAARNGDEEASGRTANGAVGNKPSAQGTSQSNPACSGAADGSTLSESEA